mmetsp:Transcript_60999/g.163790  ORF Transcript_60999/g.163790 Transcript_60999/m.163790 type:complete len:356 (+) Transcript_60999:1140-2207(+)
MKYNGLEVVALNNGFDQLVSKGDYRELGSGYDASVLSGVGKKTEVISDGANVVIGGSDTSPEYGLEGIVVNVVDSVDGGKVCMVMLNEDSSKLITVPICNLLTGDAASEGIQRRKALQELGAKVPPPSDELSRVLGEYQRRGLSLKKMLAELRQNHPLWDISEKRLKKLLSGEVGLAEGPAAKAAENGAGAQPQPIAAEAVGAVPASFELVVESLSISRKLSDVKEYIQQSVECVLCFDSFFQGAVPMVLVACGHSICDECVAFACLGFVAFPPIGSVAFPSEARVLRRCSEKMDKDRAAAFQQRHSSRPPKWPQCPTCRTELVAENERALRKSCVVQNFAIRHIIDLINEKAVP